MESPDDIIESGVHFEDLKIPLPEPASGLRSVTGKLGIPEWWPSGSRVGVVLARGSAAEEPLLELIQRELTKRRYLTLRFPMPYMAAGRSHPNDLRTMERVYRAAIAEFTRDPTTAPAHIFAGGKNQGALATVQLVTARLRIEGVFFLGFPLHKQDDPSQPRTDQLYRATNPMLFVQGDRDRYCNLPALRSVLGRVGAPVKLQVVKAADQKLRASKRSGRSREQVEEEILGGLVGWMKQILGDAA